jgi:hypothetical protein
MLPFTERTPKNDLQRSAVAAQSASFGLFLRASQVESSSHNDERLGGSAEAILSRIDEQ